MKPTRPIKTFGTWLLETVKIGIFKADDGPDWGGEDMDTWIENTLGLSNKYGQEPLNPNIYSHTISGFPQTNSITPHTFHFPNKLHAEAFRVRWGGEHVTVSMDQSILRNEAIFGNYTLRDMMDTFGDPLPYKIKDIILDLDYRNIGYFNYFGHLHQEWSKRQEWPADFVYQCPTGDHDPLDSHYKHCWLMSVCGFDGFKNHLRGIEFADKHKANLFRLRFGEDPMWDKTDYSDLDKRWEEYVENLWPMNRGW